MLLTSSDPFFQQFPFASPRLRQHVHPPGSAESICCKDAVVRWHRDGRFDPTDGVAEWSCLCFHRFLQRCRGKKWQGGLHWDVYLGVENRWRFFLYGSWRRWCSSTLFQDDQTEIKDVKLHVHVCQLRAFAEVKYTHINRKLHTKYTFNLCYTFRDKLQWLYPTRKIAIWNYLDKTVNFCNHRLNSGRWTLG